MKKYRLGYDYLLLPNNSFTYKGERIGAMAFYVDFKVFDKHGVEKLFESNELEDQKLYFPNGNSCYLNNFYKCQINDNHTIEFIPNEKLLAESGYIVQYEISDYSKDIDKGFLDPVMISKEGFNEIMDANKDLFQNTDNRPAQTISYFAKEVID